MPHLSKLLVLTLVLGLTLAAPLRAQPLNLKFEHVTGADGLSQGDVHTMLQDRQGFLWFGTADGLNKYDGYDITIYKHSSFDTTSLSDNYIQTITEGPDGTLWVGTRGGGLNHFDPTTERFTHYRHDPDDANSLSHDWVLHIHIDQAGRVWILSVEGSQEGARLDRLDLATGAVTRYRHDADDPHSLGHDAVRMIKMFRARRPGFYEDREGDIWVSTLGGGLNRYDPATDGFVRYQHDPDDPNTLIDNITFRVIQDRSGMLWIVSLKGLNRFDKNAETFTRYQHDPDDPSTLSKGFIREVYEDQAGRLWLSSDAGLDVLDPATREVARRYRHDPEDVTSPPAGPLVPLYEEETGALWFFVPPP